MQNPHHDEHPDRKNGHKNQEAQNNFIKLCSWLLQQVYQNQDTLIQWLGFLFVMYGLSMVVKPVYAANAGITRNNREGNPLDEPNFHDARPVGYHQDPRRIDDVNNPHGMFADPAMRFQRPNDNFAPLNPLNNHGNLGGNPAIHNNPPGNLNPNQQGHDPIARQQRADDLNRVNHRLRRL